jgi:hypothetical protein
MTQRVASCYLYIYIYRSQPIVIYHQPNQTNLYLYTFCPSFSTLFIFPLVRSLSGHHNLQSCHGSCLSTISISLGRRRSTSLKPSGAPNCCRSQQNLTIQFLKLDCLVSIVLSRGFWSLFIWCDNTPQAATPTGGRPRITAKGADGRGHSVDFPQS